MKIIYLREALADMQWVRHYYRNLFPAGQSRARESLKVAERTILTHPFIGATCEEMHSAREFRISRTPFSFVTKFLMTALKFCVCSITAQIG